MAEASDSWRTQAYRQRVRGQIEEAMRLSGNPTNKTCIEMENHVFQKAKSRDEYLELVARLIIYVRDINSKKEKQGGRMGGTGPGGMQDPINALTNLTKTGMGPSGPQGIMGLQPGMAQGIPQQMQPGMPHGIPQQMQQGMQPGMQPGMQQSMPQGMQQGMPQGMQQGIPQGMQQGMPQGMPQGIQQVMPQGMPPGMQQGMPPGMHQGIPNQGMPPQGMPQQAMPPQSIPQSMASVIPQSMAQVMSQQMQPGMQQMQQGMQQMQQGMQRAPFQTYQPQQMQQQMPGIRPVMSQSGAIQIPRTDGYMMSQAQVAPPTSVGSMVQVSQSQQIPQNTQIQAQQNGPTSVPSSVPSPAQQQQSTSSAGTTIPSPANMLPSPSPGQVVPSPASRGASVGVASPGSALNTPGNPASVAPSPGSRQGTDEQSYLDKWKQLQKYIEPLRRMINRIDKDEDRRKDLSKMENLLGILSDSSKRLPMATLLKCEQVLEKLDFQTKTTPAPPVTTTKTEQHMCQPLLDAVAEHIHSPNLNHTLKRTFQPAVQALHGTTYQPPSPPIKRSRPDEDQNGAVPNVLQGEISRLEHRFKVNLDPLHHNGSKTVHLICKLDDKNLPSVPPITITVPENYPDSSPTCDTSADDYDATPFLRSVQKTLSDQLLKLPEKYSVTALLDIWEMSVRQACAPVSSTTK